MVQSMIGHAVARAIQRAAERVLTRKIEKLISGKAQIQARQDGGDWKGGFRCLVSGYYTAYTMRYMGIPFIIFCFLCALGTMIVGEPLYTALFGMFAFIFIILIQITKRRMQIIVYWDGGIMFLDRKDNLIARMPASVLREAEISGNKITISWEEKKYTISRNVQDNEDAVRTMLGFYGLEDK